VGSRWLRCDRFLLGSDHSDAYLFRVCFSSLLLACGLCRSVFPATLFHTPVAGPLCSRWRSCFLLYASTATVRPANAPAIRILRCLGIVDPQPEEFFIPHGPSSRMPCSIRNQSLSRSHQSRRLHPIPFGQGNPDCHPRIRARDCFLC